MGKSFIDNCQGLKLNGVYRNKAELLEYGKTILSSNNPEWLIDVFRFITEWFNFKDVVVAKTSGSTGVPKEINLKKTSMISSAQKTNTYFNLNKESVSLLCLSANYIAGKMMIVRAFVGGYNLILAEPSSKPLEFLSNKIDFVAMVPMQVSNSIEWFKNNSKVKDVIVGGGVMSQELKNKVFPFATKFFETYGMTETVSHVAIRKCGDKFYTAMEGVKFYCDERSCLVIEAPSVADESIITNDIVNLKSDIEFEWLGRIDNVINSGGVKLMPESIEAKISAYISVPFYISSVNDELLGEKLVVVINDKNATDQVFKTITSIPNLKKYEIPKSIYHLSEFPLTQNGKINRPALKSCLSKKID